MLSRPWPMLSLFAALFSFLPPASADAPPPTLLLQTTPIGIVMMPDGSYAYFNRTDPAKKPVLETPNGKEVALAPAFAFRKPPKRPGWLLLLDRDGELHEVTLKGRGDGRKIAIDRFIDVWHRKTADGQKRWLDPRPVWEGYTGALMGYRQLASGRLVVPFGKWVPGRPTAPPTGANVVTAIYSDDSGKTWKVSPSELTSPCYRDYNGNNYGACEPTIVQVKDGRVYMLMRTQAGFLYESWSKDGAEWSPAVPSRFHVSTGPPGLLELADGRLVVFWNNCEMPPRLDGQGVYAGRDALHAAISDDGGKTWRGFREVYRDPHRNETPPHRGDRGTAYPFGTFDKSGHILVLSGQGTGRRNFLRFHPDWLTATTHEDDFSRGLEAWHVFKPFGPARGYWRDRTVGAHLIDHPTRPGAKALHVRRPDDKDPDGATWNFPLGWKGKLTVRLMLREGSAGGILALTDRFFDPTDDTGERLALFHLDLDPKGKLTPGTWHTLTLRWNLTAGRCDVTLDDKPSTTLKQRHPTGNGLSYLRLHSTAREIDRVGFLVDLVRAEITDPVAPPRTTAENKEMESRYLKSLKGHRDRKTRE
jgi:hypothetical protein